MKSPKRHQQIETLMTFQSVSCGQAYLWLIASKFRCIISAIIWGYGTPNKGRSVGRLCCDPMQINTGINDFKTMLTMRPNSPCLNIRVLVSAFYSGELL